MAERKAQTMTLSGNEYAKVAERLRLFRSDFPHSKTESAYEYDPDSSITFTVWVWKDKADYMEMLKEVKDITIARGSADANGNAKGEPKAKKDFEKLETIALGRALAMLGYLASGEIASSEEMEEFEAFRAQQQEQQITDAVNQINAAKDNDQLNKVVKSISAVLKFPAVVEAGRVKRAELAKQEGKALVNKATQKPQNEPNAADDVNTAPADKKPASVSNKAQALPLEGGADANSGA